MYNRTSMQERRQVLFGGGCFWCTEAVFKMIKGVVSVMPGYAGGHTTDPTYYSVLTGDTGHAEVAKVEYDPSQVNFGDLLTVFFASHDPTTLNRQGNDVGTQYRSVVFYETDDQYREAENFIASINSSHHEGESIVTELLPLPIFYPAEKEHRDYYAQNKNKTYCQLVINPKLEKVQKEFGSLLKSL